MSTRSTIRTNVRNELNDNAATKLWSDTLLNGWIDEAIKAWSRARPRERTWSQTTTANVAAYNVPSDFIDALRVEHPTGFFRTRAAFVGGDVSPDVTVSNYPTIAPADLLYDVFGGQLVLSPAPDASGQTILTRYLAFWTSPSDDVTALDVAAEDEPALMFFTCGRALQWIALDEAKRQRFELERGSDPFKLRAEYDRDYQRHVRSRQPGVRQRRLVVRE